MALDWHKLLNSLHEGREKLGGAVLALVSLTSARFYLIFLLALNAVNWLWAYYVNKNVSQSLIVLHYNVNLGVNLIGQARNIYIIPTLGLAFILINFFLLLNIYRKSKFFIHLLLGFTLLVNIFLIASTIAVYLINFL